MPQPQNRHHAPPSHKKKKKGPTPRHQNQFSFRHNPKSKLTQTILTSPNVGVCRRCHDKIEWRKQYRKYKPRTQPGKCNQCQERNVFAAYHTVCNDCAWRKRRTAAEEEEKDQKDKIRMCAVCVKEPVIPSSNGDDTMEEEEEDRIPGKKLSLREQKAMERKRTKKKEEKEETSVSERSNDSMSIGNDHEEDNDEDENDPFLKAVGGKDRLLTGEAYQKMLLEREKESG